MVGRQLPPLMLLSGAPRHTSLIATIIRSLILANLRRQSSKTWIRYRRRKGSADDRAWSLRCEAYASSCRNSSAVSRLDLRP
jgi:hypothetical protein